MVGYGINKGGFRSYYFELFYDFGLNIAKYFLFRTKYFQHIGNFSRELCLLHVTIFFNISKEPMMEQNSKSSFPCWKYTRNKFEIFCPARYVFIWLSYSNCNFRTRDRKTKSGIRRPEVVLSQIRHK